MTPLRIGVLARSEDRGLGIQTWEVCRHLSPDRVLLVDMGELSGHFEQHPERYEPHWPTMHVPQDELGDREVVRPLVEGLDVIYFAETCYRWPFLTHAHAAGCATVCHLNPEFYGHHIDLHEPRPTQWWLPSSWLQHGAHLPEDAKLMPLPVPLDRWPHSAPLWDGTRPLRILHVSGHGAMGDRNGTRLLLAAIKEVKRPIEVTVTTQDNAMPSPGRLPPHVKYKLTRGTRDYWRLYEGHDVLVMPRRYGGLCLPIIEASGAGLGIVMSDTAPNRPDYPGLVVAGWEGSMMKAKCGDLATFTVDGNSLARCLDHLSENPAEVQQLQARARAWARLNSWDKWELDWRAQLASAKMSLDAR